MLLAMRATGGEMGYAGFIVLIYKCPEFARMNSYEKNSGQQLFYYLKGQRIAILVSLLFLCCSG